MPNFPRAKIKVCFWIFFDFATKKNKIKKIAIDAIMTFKKSWPCLVPPNLSFGDPNTLMPKSQK
jgi:hypothetical protein